MQQIKKDICEILNIDSCDIRQDGESINAISNTQFDNGEASFFTIHNSEYRICQFYLIELYGCCGVCILSTLSVHLNYRHKGLGTLFVELAEKIAKEAGYTTLLVTDQSFNTKTRSIMAKRNYRDVHSFRNARTGNLLNISIKSLIEIPENDDDDESDY